MSDNKAINFSIEGAIEDQFPNSEKNKVYSFKWLIIMLLMVSLAFNVYFMRFEGNERDKLIQYVSLQKKNKDEQDSLKQVIVGLQNQLSILLPQTKTPPGVFFEVQIGAFENFNLDEYEAELSEMRQEKHDKKNKFLLGRFAELNKALRFENDIKRLGLSGAFIVGRIDGQLTSKEEAIKAQKLR